MNLDNESTEPSVEKKEATPSEDSVSSTIHEGELVTETDDELASSNRDKVQELEDGLEKTLEEGIHLVEIPLKKVPNQEPEPSQKSVENKNKDPKNKKETKEPAQHTEDDEARARQRQKTFLLERRKQKRRQVFYGRLRVLAKIAFSFLLGFGIFKFATATFWIYESPNFEVNELHLLSRKNIEPVIQPYAGQPIYQVDPKQIETILKEKYDVIESIYVRRQLFPGRLNLMITEKEPWGELYSSADSKKPYAVVSDDYEPVLLESYDEEALTFYPDATLPKIIFPKKIFKKNKKEFSQDFLKRLNEVSYQLGTVPGLSLKYLDATNPEAVDAYFTVARVRLGKLDATRSERLGRLFALVNEISKKQDEIDEVDLRWLNQVTFHRGKYTLAEPYQEKMNENKSKKDDIKNDG